MKIYTIGRDPACDIVYGDITISRQHAVLRVYNTGKMEIIDTSNNGTYINNIRISKNVAVPLRRKDKVLFAKTKLLDWTLIADPLMWIKKGVGAFVGLLVVVCVASFAVDTCSNSGDSTESTFETGGGGVNKAVPEKEKNKDDSTNKKDTATSRSNKTWYKKELNKHENGKNNTKSQNKEDKGNKNTKKDTDTEKDKEPQVKTPGTGVNNAQIY